jgi:hypothetical protein
MVTVMIMGGFVMVVDGRLGGCESVVLLLMLTVGLGFAGGVFFSYCSIRVGICTEGEVAEWEVVPQGQATRPMLAWAGRRCHVILFRSLL